MIKRTPQEVADFYQGYVFNSCSALSWVVTPDKPKIVNGEWTWDHDSILWFALPVYALDVPVNHHWTHLYEPQGKEGKTSGNFPCSDNKSKDCYSDQAVSENKPDHLGEVYTHKEYRIVTAHKEIDSESFAKGVMAWVERGWIPTGGISFDKQGCPYQAMVRGV